jgi:serine beta-lactamase-like protein LACTB
LGYVGGYVNDAQERSALRFLLCVVSHHHVHISTLPLVYRYRLILPLLIVASVCVVGASGEMRSTAHAQSDLTDQTIVELKEAFASEVQSQELVGAAAAVIIDGKVALLLVEGMADRATAIPVDPRKTLFRWASISKPLTAVAAMQLHQQDLLDLDGDVRELVPEFPDKGVVVSPRQLMGHLGGIVHYRNGPVIRTTGNSSLPHPYEDVVGALDTFKESPLVNTPGEAFAYSTHGYILLSAVVQRAGNHKFADQVDERIATPLGMTTLQPDYQWLEIPGRATGYRKQSDDIVESRDADVSWKLGGGGFVSSVADLGAFAGGLLQGSLLQPDIQALVWTQQTTSNGESPPHIQVTGYGLGFGVREQFGRRIISHNGAQAKTRTCMLLYPDEMLGVVVMTNCEWGKPEAIATALANMIPAASTPSVSVSTTP